MNAAPILVKVAAALRESKLEAVMIGNSAAALQGAPVTTLDIDFMFRKTEGNLEKLKKLADILNSVVLKPFHPVSDLYRVVNDEQGLQLDFMSQVHGIKSFVSLRSRSETMEVGQEILKIASLHDIVKSKKAANRAKDRAVLEILEATLKEKENE